MRAVRFACFVALFAGTIALAQSNPVPFVNDPLVPMSTAPGGTGFTLTVNGTGFVPGATVNWNGSALSTIFGSASQLTAEVPASNIAAAGTASVTVANPTPGGGVSNVVFFQVTPWRWKLAFAAKPFAAGAERRFVIAADFDNDGKLDIATEGGPLGNGISILLANGDGTFQPHADYRKGLGPGQIVAADFDKDGKLDLVAANDSDNSISVLLGNGDGTFQRATNYSAGLDPWGLLTADFNHDGKLDLIVGNLNTNRGAVMLGNGDGTFQRPVEFNKGTMGGGAMAAGDLDQDGNLDLALPDYPGRVLILLGNGDGTFQHPVPYAANSYSQLVPADFNGDGHLDLAVLDFLGGAVSVLLGNGDGTFKKAVEFPTSPSPLWIVTGDFDGDGRLDLGIASIPSTDLGYVSVLLGYGDGVFQMPASFPAGEFPEGLAAGDFDGNGTLDLVVPNSGSTVTVLLQTTAALSTTSVDFGPQKVGTISDPRNVALMNVGSTDLYITNITVGGPNAREFSQTNNCSPTLPPGAVCNVSITFAPRVRGERKAKVSIADNAPASPQIIFLQGFGKQERLGKLP
jgi:hypothetical protein